jgi:hypothetical protein
LCAISEPLVKVLRLVDGDKPTMGYLYEAMDRAKEVSHWYYEDKGEKGFTRRAQIRSVIDERWNNTLHCLILTTNLYLNPAYSYACRFRFDDEVMDGFFQCVRRMVLTSAKCLKISKQMDIYKLAIGTFGYDIAIQDKTTRMPSKLQVKLVSNSQISMSFLSLYLLLHGNIIHCLSFPFIHYRCLVGKLWQKSPRVIETCHLGA